MARHSLRQAGGVLTLFLVAFLSGSAEAAAPTLLSAASRMTHGSAGTFDIQLPQGNRTGIECRTLANGLNIVLTFDQPVVHGSATIASGIATINSSPSLSNRTMIVQLTGVKDAQTISLNVSATNGAGQSRTHRVHFRVLQGDVNASGTLSAADVSICKTALTRGSSVNGGNLRCDFDANGLLTSADLNAIKALVSGGSTVGGGPAAGSTPTISAISNQTAISGQPMTPVGFMVAETGVDPSTLFVSATSDTQTVVANGNIVLGGTGGSRTISLTPASGITSTTSCNITVTVSDGVNQAQTTFLCTVVPPPTVYLATLQPIPGVTSFGSGSAILSLSGDLTYASLKYSYSNLAGADSDDAVYAPGDVVLYDVPMGKQHGDLQPDGSYKWVFGPEKAAAIAAIQANQAYLTIESAAYPAGELRGTFQKVVGSQTFTPPPPPPAITINPPTQYDASRFLQQAAFGGQISEINALSNPLAANASTAINDWLTNQFNQPMPIAPTYDAATPSYSSSSMYQWIYNRVTTPQAPNNYGDSLIDDRIHEAWWRNAVTAPDQLRQRVATALSELFVVSEINDNIDGNLPGLASYYDMLADDAFGNFRQLLADVTFHPIMGTYLNFQGNAKATPPASPNENYAREIMQLFSIGLYMLQPDGTLMLDQNGQPIPTYDQSTITNFAQVFTGWNTNGTAVNIPTLVAGTNVNVDPPAVSNFGSFYQKRMVLNPTNGSNHSGTVKYLLGYTNNGVWTGTYPSAPSFPAATQPSYIPANASQTATTATNELNFALDDIFYHPNVGPFICRQLIQRLVCSNPSPAYVYRVAQVFNNDGTGVRGNMQAVITAILTDYEARNTALLAQPGYGKPREPMIRMANVLRSCNGFSVSGKWFIGKTDNTFAQTILRSPTVFNFFDPHFVQPGVIQTAGLVSPEFDIIYETTITNAQNMLYTGIYANYNTNPVSGTGFRGDAYGGDVYLDFSTAGNGLINVAQSQGIGPLLDRVSLLLTGSPLDPNVKSRIQLFIAANISTTNYLAQAQAAVHLVASSSQCSVQK
jgi:uncharacterized protein (DUF1800 family)